MTLKSSVSFYRLFLFFCDLINVLPVVLKVTRQLLSVSFIPITCINPEISL